jgi:ABC-2 type transport system ATP-binding protein
MLGLDRPDAGQALFDGRPYRDLPHPVREVGVMLDAAYVHPNRRARQHLAWMAAASGMPRSRVDDVLAQVGLDSVARKHVRTFSLGMKQRLGLAGALLGDPHTVILDEPANGLDPEGIRWIREMLKYLAGRGCTVLVSSHQLAEIALMADDLVVIGAGRLIASGPLEDFVSRHSDAWVSVRSPQAAHLAELVTALDGTSVRFRAPDIFDARGTTSEAIGRLAHEHGVALYELAPQMGSLEDAFLEMTSTFQQFSTNELPQ